MTKYPSFPTICFKVKCFLELISLFVLGPSDILKLHVSDKEVVQGLMFSILKGFQNFINGFILLNDRSAHTMITRNLHV